MKIYMKMIGRKIYEMKNDIERMRREKYKINGGYRRYSGKINGGYRRYSGKII